MTNAAPWVQQCDCIRGGSGGGGLRKAVMAEIVFTPGWDHVHGHVGTFIYKEQQGRNILAKKPDRVHQPNTPAQQAVRDKFGQAATYAKSALADPQVKPVYVAKARADRSNPFAEAVKDWLTPPVVDEIVLTSYHKQVGDVIVIKAHDDTEVVRAEVTLQDGNNNTLESGSAAWDAASGSWKYTATVDATTAATVTVTASVYDRPNHAGGKTATV